MGARRDRFRSPVAPRARLLCTRRSPRPACAFRGRQERRVHGVVRQCGNSTLVQVEQRGSDPVLAIQRGAEHRRIVGVDGHRDAGIDECAQRVLGVGTHGTGGDVRRRTHFERDAMGHQVFQQRRILRGGRAVPDTLGVQELERIPDGPWPGCLTGVRNGVQTGGAGPLEGRCEPGAGGTDLRATQAERDQRCWSLFNGDGGSRLGCVLADLARDVEDPAQHDAEVAFCTHPGVLDRLQVARDRHPGQHRGVRRAGQLGIPDVLRRHVPGHLVGE